MNSSDTYKEWRVLTPILLAVIVLCGGVISYLGIDKLNNMADINSKTFMLISEVKNNFNDYKVETGEHFAKIDQELLDFKPK